MGSLSAWKGACKQGRPVPWAGRRVEGVVEAAGAEPDVLGANRAGLGAVHLDGAGLYAGWPGRRCRDLEACAGALRAGRVRLADPPLLRVASEAPRYPTAGGDGRGGTPGPSWSMLFALGAAAGSRPHPTAEGWLAADPLHRPCPWQAPGPWWASTPRQSRPGGDRRPPEAGPLRGRSEWHAPRRSFRSAAPGGPGLPGRPPARARRRTVPPPSPWARPG